MSRLSFRLLTFNALILFLPIGSFLYLDTFEDQLLEKIRSILIENLEKAGQDG